MRKSWLKSVMTKRLLVHLTSGQSLDGSLTAIMADGIVLRAAKLLADSDKAVSMAGEVYVPREKVAFVQLTG